MIFQAHKGFKTDVPGRCCSDCETCVHYCSSISSSISSSHPLLLLWHLNIVGTQTPSHSCCLCEFYLIHSFTSVPMGEGFMSKHGSELLRCMFEEFLWPKI